MAESKLGSTWGKWDLHFHTPSSFDYEKKSISNKDIVDTLINAEIKAVAITDHHYIDVERILDIRNKSTDKLLVLPGIEFRSELGDKPIHYIGIFPPDNPEYIWNILKGALGLNPEDIRRKGGDEKIYIPIEKGHKIISKLGGIITIHAGAKANSIESIENKEQFQQRIKYDVTQKYIDMLEVGQFKDIDRYLHIVFPNTGLSLPVIIGSDNHNITK